jgi:hypothetical protein
VTEGDPALVEGETKCWSLNGRLARGDIAYRTIDFRRPAKVGLGDRQQNAHVRRGRPEQVHRAHQRREHKRERASLIDTLVHEELHILFPRFGETMICAMTERRLRSMSKQQKAKLYARIRRR